MPHADPLAENPDPLTLTAYDVAFASGLGSSVRCVIYAATIQEALSVTARIYPTTNLATIVTVTRLDEARPAERGR